MSSNYYINNPIKSISKSISKIKNSISDSYSWMNNIWMNHRWELFVCISILTLIFCYFFVDQEKYNGIQYDQSLIKKKGKKVPKKHETKCRLIMETIFNVPFSSVRPDFLKNPKTGKNLELDMYNQHLRLAVEYQGAQHRTYTPFFHKSYSDFLGQVERDNYKKKRCEEEGIDLICVPDSVKYEELGDYITMRLRELKRM
jgi:hypothetical protein